MTQDKHLEFIRLYDQLPDQKKETIQRLRERMAKDLNINVKDKIPFDLYLQSVKSKPLIQLEYEGITYKNTFLIRGRSMRILEIIDPDYKTHYNIKE